MFSTIGRTVTQACKIGKKMDDGLPQTGFARRLRRVRELRTFVQNAEGGAVVRRA